MVDMRLLKSRGISSGSYRRIFSGPAINYPPRIQRLANLISNRAKWGIKMNLKEWRSYAAIDVAYDTPFNQTTPTLIQNILAQQMTVEETREALKAWGLKDDDLWMKVEMPNGSFKLVPNPPVFFQIFVPLVKAYVTIRLAKIFNERNLSPLLKYQPLKQTARNRVLCEIITDLVNTISTCYGYSSVLRQAVQQMLKYGVMLTFPYEEWHCEKQVVFDDDGNEATVTDREGLRYYIPHPTRMYYDLIYPLTTINSDTGVRWLGHWSVQTYGEILDNRKYWNRRSIFSGTNWFLPEYDSTRYFQEIYPCAMAPAFTARFGISPPKREDQAAWYNNGDRDQAIFLTQHYEKLVPSEWGLGKYNEDNQLESSYDYPVWHRFVLAGDNTIIYAEPMAYTPSWFMGYHYDAQAGRQSSLGLEAIPWQDHVGNILSQIILTAKQNLANVTFYDNQIVDKDDVEKLKNLGEMMYRGMNFVSYDSLLLQRAGLTAEKAFIPVRLEKQSIVELLQALPMALNIMERVLQISAQEVGSAASHQQSKAEIMQIGGASTNGATFTASTVDEGIDAWKRQLFSAARAYADTNITAQVSADIENLDKHLVDLGFTVVHRDTETVLVRGKKNSLRLEGFAASNKGPDQAEDQQVAQAIFTTAGIVANNAALIQAVGAKNILALLENAARLSGAPRDFKLSMPPQGENGEVSPAVQQAIQQAIQSAMQAVGEKIAKPAAEEMAQDKARIDQIEQAIQQLQGIYQIAKQTQDKNRIAAEKAQADQARKDAAFKREQARKDAVASAELQRKQAQAQNDMSIAQEKAKTEIAIDKAKASTEQHIATASAAHSAALESARPKAEPKKEV